MNQLFRSARTGIALLTVIGFFITSPATALEIIVEEDIIQGVVVEDQLVRVADNAIFLIDTSSSMNREYMDTGKTKLEVALEVFKERNAYFPEIGHNFGLYEYTPWSVVYPLQTYDREKVAEALGNLPTEGEGVTPLATGMAKTREIVSPLTGRTVVFLFYDGSYSGQNPDPEIWGLVKENDVCLMMISSANERENEELTENVSRLSACSRVIPLEHYLERPEYMSGALFDVRATENVITTTESRIAGVEVKNIAFGFDKTDLNATDKAELDELGNFMADKPDSYAVLIGYTDNIGIEDYNEHLSQRRSEQVAEYLTTAHGIDKSRLVLHWHGSDNPIASNDTAEGRAANRRVEVAVGGI